MPQEPPIPNLPQIILLAAKVRLLPVNLLKPHANKSRVRPPEQIRKLAANMRAYGFALPIVVGSNNQVLAGHARLEAAIQLGLDEVPVVSQAHLSEEDQRAFMLADNKLSQLSSWDDGALKLELQFLAPLELKASLWDLGFSQAEVDKALSIGFSGDGPSDPPPGPDSLPITRPGDVWLLGDHRLACGDATTAEAYDALMAPGEKARMMFTDPPYNLKISGFVAGRGIDRREFPMASGEMSVEEFTEFLLQSMCCSADNLMDRAVAFVCMDWRHMYEMIESGDAAFDELANVCVWAKSNAGMGAFYRSQHELVFVFRKGEGDHVNNFGLGSVRYRTNLWQYPGASGFHSDRMNDLALHPTAKPVVMVMDAIMDVSNRGDLVLDPFGGSGSTLIAAHKAGRVARVLELDPLYVDVIVRRYQGLTGGEVYLQATGQTFEEVEAERLGVCSPIADMKLLQAPQS
ncbi:DNA methyltransferase [Brevundimonas sp. NIBR11]|uniref:site-specific DNA-methyltransferase n=1 Tax=Brevundimonas sp. NIBR11 TaxID=3015999 RepID=UPI0022F03B41|nr:DNA methyltransferase [Brevundimonas sp. NIBR11]WGM30608.1 hypothetical protein KKHFBJBL_00833 [Brevundimonas sp. NIBR11]